MFTIFQCVQGGGGDGNMRKKECEIQEGGGAKYRYK